MPKLSPLQQQQRRDRILDAAENCFSRYGFHQTSMQMICKQAGISAGALYVYFSSKEALIEGIAIRNRTEISDRLTAAAGHPDFLGSLQDLMMSCIVDQPRSKAALCLEMGAESTRNPAVSSTMREFDRVLHEQLVHLLNQAVGRGRIAPRVSLPTLAALLAVIGDGLFWRRALDIEFDPASVTQGVMAMVEAIACPVETGGEAGDPIR